MARKEINKDLNAVLFASNFNDNINEVASGVSVSGISSTNNANKTISDINTAFTALDDSLDRLADSDSATSAAAKINANFDILYYNAEHPSSDSESITFDGVYCTVAGKEINSSGEQVQYKNPGNEYEYNRASSVFIEIPAGATLRYSSGHSGSRYAFYNSSKSFISGGVVSEGNNVSVTIPANAVYFRFTNVMHPYDNVLRFTFTCDGAYATALAVKKANDYYAQFRMRRHVLMFGNSYTENYTEFITDSNALLKAVLSNIGVSSEICSIRTAIQGAYLLQDWAVLAGIPDAVPANSGVSPTETFSASSCFGTGYTDKSYSKFTVPNLLSFPWDVVCFQERSTRGNYTLGSDDEETITLYMGKLADRVRELCPNPDVKIIYSMGHANLRRGKTWESVSTAVHNMYQALSTKVDAIMPIATAVANLRRSKYQDDEYDYTSYNGVSAKGWFSNDGSHLAAGAGRYTAGCCLIWSMFHEYATNTLSNDTTAFDPYVEGGQNLGKMAVTNENRADLQQFALNACEYPWEIHTITE